MSAVAVDEYCRFCGRPARQMHPAGVIAGQWTCLACGGRQAEAHKGDDYVVIDPRYDIELIGDELQIEGD